MSFLIRAWTKDDLRHCQILYASCFLKAWPYDAFVALYESDNTVAYVAILEEKVQGMVVLKTALNQADVLTLAVQPEYRGKGMAKALMKAVLGAFSQIGGKDVFLEVSFDNQRAIALYHSLGFIICGIRPGYYNLEDGSLDAHVMKLSL